MLILFNMNTRPGSVQATVNIEVYKKDQNSVPQVEKILKDKITFGYIGTLEVDKSEYSIGVKGNENSNENINIRNDYIIDLIKDTVAILN